MDNRTFKITSTNNHVPLKITPGHFATNHSHINYYLDVTTLKARMSEARQAAEQLLAQDPALTSCPATAERVTELFTQQADALN